jgi:branched-subunit amino acid aminotransferase/4-amino-4-deoxychorismate lyase
MKIYLNGQIVPAEQAQVSVEDAGLQHAVGLFETMSAHHGRAFRLDAHLARLKRSAAELGLAAEMDTAPLADAVDQTLRANELREARVRLTVTAGTLSMLRQEDGPAMKVRQTVAVVPSPPTVFDPAYFERGVTVAVYGQAANPFDVTAGHKTLAYWPRLRSLRQAAALGCSETIWLNVTNHLASGAVSNVFLVKDGRLLTPIAHGEEQDEALPAPVLPGTTRGLVIELAQRLGIDVQRRMLSVEELLNADEVFLTSANWRVLPVSAVEKKTIGAGQPGPVTAQLRQAVLDTIESETAGETRQD